MRRLFAVALSALLVFGFAPVAKADVAGLTLFGKRSFLAARRCSHHASGQSPLGCIAKPRVATMASLT